MPGREAVHSSQPPQRTGGVSASSTTRRMVTTSAPYMRRGACSTSPGGDGTIQKQGGPSSTRSCPTSPAPQDVAVPACSSCVARYRASEDVARALAAVLANAKELFLDDALHHYSGDEAWIRVLRALGWSGVEAEKTASTSGAST